MSAQEVAIHEEDLREAQIVVPVLVKAMVNFAGDAKVLLRAMRAMGKLANMSGGYKKAAVEHGFLEHVCRILSPDGGNGSDGGGGGEESGGEGSNSIHSVQHAVQDWGKFNRDIHRNTVCALGRFLTRGGARMLFDPALIALLNEKKLSDKKITDQKVSDTGGDGGGGGGGGQHDTELLEQFIRADLEKHGQSPLPSPLPGPPGVEEATSVDTPASYFNRESALTDERSFSSGHVEAPPVGVVPRVGGHEGGGNQQPLPPQEQGLEEEAGGGRGQEEVGDLVAPAGALGLTMVRDLSMCLVATMRRFVEDEWVQAFGSTALGSLACTSASARDAVASTGAEEAETRASSRRYRLPEVHIAARCTLRLVRESRESRESGGGGPPSPSSPLRPIKQSPGQRRRRRPKLA